MPIARYRVADSFIFLPSRAPRSSLSWGTSVVSASSAPHANGAEGTAAGSSSSTTPPSPRDPPQGSRPRAGPACSASMTNWLAVRSNRGEAIVVGSASEDGADAGKSPSSPLCRRSRSTGLPRPPRRKANDGASSTIFPKCLDGRRVSQMRHGSRDATRARRVEDMRDANGIVVAPSFCNH